jgi:hypothetical protein
VSTIAASCGCAATFSSIPRPHAGVGLGEGWSRIRSGRAAREQFITPRLRFKTLDELNAWLLDKCIAYAKAHRHPELAKQTVWEVFEAERPKLARSLYWPVRWIPRGAGIDPAQSGGRSRFTPTPTAS